MFENYGKTSIGKTAFVILLFWFTGCPQATEDRQQSSPQAPSPATKAPISSPVASMPLVEIPDEGVEKNIVWAMNLQHKATEIYTTPEDEIVVIGPDRITVFDHRGRHRWHRNLAPGDRALPSENCIFVHMSDRSGLVALKDRGAIRWERRIEGQVDSLGDGTVLATDAACVKAIECRRGRETWMFLPERIRTIRLLYATDKKVVLLGERGKGRLLYSLDLSGHLEQKIVLPPHTVSAKILSKDLVLTRTNTELTAVNSKGEHLWKHPLTQRTEVSIQDEDIILAGGSPDGMVKTELLDENGLVRNTCTISVGAEPVSISVHNSAASTFLLSACSGALSSCAERIMSAGPFNRLWACNFESSSISNMIDQRSELSFDISQINNSIVTFLTSEEGHSSQVIRISPDIQYTLLAHVSDRRMVGPSPGPNNLILVATCRGPRCEEPWMLFAIASQEEQ